MPRLEGHRRGAKAVRRTVEFCRKNGVAVLTLYAFSTENWRRPESEVTGLMKLLSQFVDSELEELHGHNIRIRIMGQLDRLPDDIQHKLSTAMETTRENTSLILNIALSYGGRQDILSAALRLADALRKGDLDPQAVDETLFSSMLDTAELPDPDLLIRTGGEMRISNFLLWQCAYSEFYFTDILWPDFDDEAIMVAIDDYKSRQRRFGMIPEQVET